MSDQKYVLIKRDLYWRPMSAGYTGIKKEAGRFTSEVEGKVSAYPILPDYTPSYGHEDVYAIPIEKAPEFTRSCDDFQKIQVLMKDREELRHALQEAANHIKNLEGR